MKVGTYDIASPELQLDPTLFPKAASEYAKPGDLNPVIVKSNTRLIFSFHSKPKIIWDLLITACAIYLSISIPFYLSFSQSTLFTDGVLGFHLLISLLFLFDILLGLRTTFSLSSTAEEVKNPQMILKHYVLSFRFIFDLVAVIPFELINPANLGLFRLLKLHRLFRLKKLVSIMKIKHTTHLLLEFLLLFIFLLLFVHFAACLLFIVVNEEENWIPPESYPSNSTVFYGLDYNSQYWISFYHSVEFIAGFLNGGDSEREFLFFSCFYIIGAVLVGIVLADMTVLVKAMRKEEILFSKTQNSLTTSMRTLRLPSNLRIKVIEFFIANYNSLKFNKEYTKFIEMLPPSLVRRVNSTYLMSVIEKNQIIGSDKKILKFALLRLKSRMVHPSVRILAQFDQPSNLYFIAEGLCHVEVMDEHGHNHLVSVLKDGDNFGEISMLFKTECTATVTSITYTSLSYLTQENFSELLDVFPKTSELLMTKIVSYNDSWMSFCKKMIRLVPYLSNCDITMLLRILYSLKQERYESSHVIVHTGDLIDFIYFIVEGEIEFFTHVYDRSAGLFINDSFALKGELDDGDPKILFPLGRVTIGSVLYSKLALTKAQAITSMRAVTSTHLLKLPVELLESLCRERAALSEGLDQFKAGLFKHDQIRGELVASKFPIDVIRNENYASGASASLWNSCVKLKNAVLKIIESKRNSKIANFGASRKMVKKLKAMNYAESVGRQELVRLIANDRVSEDVVKVLDLLEEKELHNYLLMQFALKANETTVVCQFLSGRIKSCRKKIRKLKTDYEEIGKLGAVIEKLLFESIRLTKK